MPTGDHNASGLYMTAALTALKLIAMVSEVIAYGVDETVRREVIGVDVGEAEAETFWREFAALPQGPRSSGRAPVCL